jgi:muramoyltetrapeptide carboxypeptidase LdcA involved in peptidoglycan recycling
MREKMNKSEIIRPPEIALGATVGIFTPSFPANVHFQNKYFHAVSQITQLGFKVKEGSLTKKFTHQGYRSGTPQERAKEFMELILDSEVDFLMSTIGGCNSSSMIPYLDFEAIRKHPKVITGYSDVTSLHMAILTQSKVSTFYGPALVPSFGEWPKAFEPTVEKFLEAVKYHENPNRALHPFPRWSNQLRDSFTDDWRTGERVYHDNSGWKVLSEGKAKAPLIIANLNTLLALAGTSYFPKLDGEILLLEEMDSPLSMEERSLCQLKLMGTFNNISGLIISKPEKPDFEGANFSLDQLILEIVGNAEYPIISGFDCGHTYPMYTLAQMTELEVQAMENNLIIKLGTNMVSQKLLKL